MNFVIKFLLRLLFVIAGLVFALSLIFVMVLLLALWVARAVWCKLTGQPINPFVMRMNPRAGFDQVFKQADRGADALQKPQRRGMDDVTDVEIKR
jgi:flagellar biosynthesis protein FlhB